MKTITIFVTTFLSFKIIDNIAKPVEHIVYKEAYCISHWFHFATLVYNRSDKSNDASTHQTHHQKTTVDSSEMSLFKCKFYTFGEVF